MKHLILFFISSIFCLSTAFATDDPLGITLDGAVIVSGTKNPRGIVAGITVPKPYVPNFGMGRIFFTRRSKVLLSSDEMAIKLKFDANVDSTFVDLFWLMPTDFYWALGFGSGLVSVAFDNVIALSSISVSRLTYFESEISKKEKLIQGRHIFTRISFFSLDSIEFHLGIHHLSYDQIEIITGNLSDNLPSLNANMVTLGLGVHM